MLSRCRLIPIPQTTRLVIRPIYAARAAQKTTIFSFTASGASPAIVCPQATRRGFSTGTSAATPEASSEVVENLRRLSAWPGVHPDILAQLQISFPHIQLPTPAQHALLTSVMGGLDVFLKDQMGRGKTLGIALLALALVYRPDADYNSANAPRVLILAPTPYLVNQVVSNLAALSPPASAPLFQSIFSTDNVIPKTPIVVSTPQTFPLGQVGGLEFKHVFCDEPDTMLGSAVPSRQVSSTEKIRNPSSAPRHTPAIIPLLHGLLGIHTQPPGGKKDGLHLDFSNRKTKISTVWTSATLSNQTRRFVKNNGWVRRGSDIVDLDFTNTASEKQAAVRKEFRAFASESIFTSSSQDGSQSQTPPEHIALAISENGAMRSLFDIDHPSDTYPSSKTGPSKPSASSSNIPEVLLESLALIHATSPPPSGTLAIVLPPEGSSLKHIQQSLKGLHVDTIRLDASIISQSASVTPADLPGSPLVLATRSSMPGLHLPNLHTIYLLSGIDMAGITPAQKRDGGVAGRMRMYDIIAGRLGRLGSKVEPTLTGEGGSPNGQRIVSLVMVGSVEERGLRDLFSAKRAIRTGWEESNEVIRKLSPWRPDIPE